MSPKQTVIVFTAFDVEFDSFGDIDSVYLNGNDIIDILTHDTLYELKAQAKSDHIADCKDRGIKYKGGA